MAVEFGRTFAKSTQRGRATIVRRNLVLAMGLCCITRLGWVAYSIAYLNEATGKYVDLIVHADSETSKFILGRMSLAAYFFIGFMVGYQWAMIGNSNNMQRHAFKAVGGLVLLVHGVLTFMWVGIERNSTQREGMPIYETSIHFITASTLLLAVGLMCGFIKFSTVLSESAHSSVSSHDAGLQKKVTLRVMVLIASTLTRTVMFLYRPISGSFLDQPYYPFLFYYIPEVLLVLVVYCSMPDTILQSISCGKCCAAEDALHTPYEDPRLQDSPRRVVLFSFQNGQELVVHRRPGETIPAALEAWISADLWREVLEAYNDETKVAVDQCRHVRVKPDTLITWLCLTLPLLVFTPIMSYRLYRATQKEAALAALLIRQTRAAQQKCSALLRLTQVSCNCTIVDEIEQHYPFRRTNLVCLELCHPLPDFDAAARQPPLTRQPTLPRQPLPPLARQTSLKESAHRIRQQSVSSGHVPCLLHVRKIDPREDQGNIRVLQVPLARTSLNQDDCFILDAGAKIYTWFGKYSSPHEKHKCNTHAENVEAERNGKSKVLFYEDDEESFWAYLGGRGPIQEAADAGVRIPREQPLPLLRIGASGHQLPPPPPPQLHTSRHR
jgi:hypothetical protein